MEVIWPRSENLSQWEPTPFRGEQEMQVNLGILHALHGGPQSSALPLMTVTSAPPIPSPGVVGKVN